MEPTQRKAARDRRGELLTLLNGWDPAGLLAAGAPRDEYDCVVDKVLSALSHGGSREEIVELLDSEILEHFGVQPNETGLFATKVATWYELSTRDDSGSG
jgi:hypothetical protein